MNALATAINTAWMLSCRRERERFQRAAADLDATQQAVLSAIIGADADTAFGDDHGLAPGCPYERFRERVPISTYDAHAPYIDRIAAGEGRVLTTDAVRVLQPTSGSTGGRKLIPQTPRLQRLLQRAISTWIGDLLVNRPAVRRGRAYWSISPAFAPEPPTSGGVPVGFADDTEYLSGPERLAVRRILAVPPDVIDSGSITEFRHRTLAHLLTTPDLALISVWSPTFLTGLIDELYRATADIVDRAAALDPGRAARAGRVLRSRGDRSNQLAELWPALALISCWADGSAAAQVAPITELFSHVELQPKGLLATEAFVSFPLVGRDGAALAARSHFFEFLHHDEAGGTGGCTSEPILGHQLEPGRCYKPVVTTGGGLWRYLIDDVVEVVGHEGQCPLVRFRGRAATSDLVGEKLDEVFVAGVLDRVVDGYALLVADARPATSTAAGTATRPGYRVLLGASGGNERSLAVRVDGALRANPHYDYARRLGQLRAVEVGTTCSPVAALYEHAMIERGVRLGDIKPTRLVRDTQLAALLLAASDG